jgi:hypothetical protein
MDLEKLKKLHDKAYNHGADTREKASDDLLFYHVTHWDDDLLSNSQLQYRGQFDILRKAGRQILSSLSANPVQVDFEPKAESRDDGADLLDGLYRSDDRANSSIEAYSIGSQEAVVCGVGAWMLYTEYQTNQLGDFNQVIKRKPIYEANNKVFWDPNAKLQDKSDAKYCSVLHTYSKDGYKELVSELTGQDEEDVVIDNFKTPERSYAFPWLSSDDVVYVSEFYCREKIKTKVLLLVSPMGTETLMRESDLEEIMDDLIDEGYEITAEREVERWQVTRYIASGFEILDESIIAGEYIPVVPMYGERGFVEDEEYYEGITRLAKDPQRLRNFQMSYLADIVSRSPRPKSIYYPEQVQGFEHMYEDNGADNNYPYLLQNRKSVAGEDLPLGAVAQTPEQTMPQALIASIQLSREAVQDVADPGLPQNIADPDLSGKAVYALQNRLDNQTMVYQTNMKHAKRRDGVVYASMASEVYDAPRKVSLTLPDGRTKKASIMEAVLDKETGEMVVLNDITNIEFDVFADIGPAYSTQKEQTREDLLKLLGMVQPGTAEFQMLLLKYLNLANGSDMEDIREYANKQLVLSGYKEPETEEEMAMVMQAQQNAGQPDAQTQALLMEGQARMMEGQAAVQNEINDANKIAVDQFNAETNRQKVQIQAAEAGVKIQNTQADTQGKQIDNIMKLRQQPANQLRYVKQ